MSKDTFAWITARDGSVHATRPPINADGQTMLCGQLYDRRDLRIRSLGTDANAPPDACPTCRDRAAAGSTAEPGAPRPERKAPMWP